MDLKQHIHDKTKKIICLPEISNFTVFDSNEIFLKLDLTVFEFQRLKYNYVIMKHLIEDGIRSLT